MDFCHIVKVGADGEPDTVEVVMTTHHHGEPDDDPSPLQLISAERLAYLLRIEVEYLRLLEGMAEPVEAAPGVIPV